MCPSIEYIVCEYFEYKTSDKSLKVHYFLFYTLRYPNLLTVGYWITGKWFEAY